MTKQTIEVLSEIRSGYNCFDDSERPFYEALSEAIEALSCSVLPNRSDLISRQDAIDEANAWLLDCFKVQKQDRSCGLIRRLEDIPSAQPERKKGRWIPVSERLPEEYEYVLLCDREPEPDENTDDSRMAVGWLEDGQICCWDDRAARKEFVAWMPLPEPYREE